MSREMASLPGLIAFTLVLAAGQILFKLTANRNPEITGIGGIRALLFDPVFWAALVLYGGATLLWIALLQKVPLSYAYPFVALAFVIVPVGAAIFYQEHLHPNFFVGAALIVAGIWICAVSNG